MRCAQVLLPLIVLICGLAVAPAAQAWGDEGHRIVALIAQHYLRRSVRQRVQALLDGDDSGLTRDTSMASEATWADHYRDSDRRGAARGARYEQTWRWHFVDLELTGPDLAQACYGHPPLPPGTPASQGPADDCIVDKIEQFTDELSNPLTPMPERRVALQFLLHLIGDLHQPLHAADDHDAGGNRLRVVAPGLPPGSLHHYWDTEFVRGLGTDAPRVAARLVAQISRGDRTAWSRGSVTDWAMQSFTVAQAVAYGTLPPARVNGEYRLSEDYVRLAENAVGTQLSRAGVRLALVLNRALQ